MQEANNLPDFDTMTQEEILEWAASNGHTKIDAPPHYSSPGYRIKGASRHNPAMDAANVRLFEIQTGRKL